MLILQPCCAFGYFWVLLVFVFGAGQCCLGGVHIWLKWRQHTVGPAVVCPVGCVLLHLLCSVEFARHTGCCRRCLLCPVALPYVFLAAFCGGLLCVVHTAFLLQLRHLPPRSVPSAVVAQLMAWSICMTPVQHTRSWLLGCLCSVCHVLLGYRRGKRSSWLLCQQLLHACSPWHTYTYSSRPTGLFVL